MKVPVTYVRPGHAIWPTMFAELKAGRVIRGESVELGVILEPGEAIVTIKVVLEDGRSVIAPIGASILEGVIQGIADRRTDSP